MFGKVKKPELYKRGIFAGVAEILYIILVVIVILSIDRFMSEQAGGPLSMMAVLILLVISAGISGFFIFGYPVYYALQKKYYESIFTLVVSFLTLIAAFALVLIVIFLI